MAKIERYAAKGVFDPPAYSQAVKISGGQTILYITSPIRPRAGSSNPVARLAFAGAGRYKARLDRAAARTASGFRPVLADTGQPLMDRYGCQS
ncbi:MAG TPA: hypothetical protein VMF05_01700 [Stellaceae bacterium]|nr:hypothetical protein [Stellaceae bacterium]